LYCLRLTDKILILGNGGVKYSRTYEEDETLQGYVIDLQKFERFLKQEVRSGKVEITEKEIITDKPFEL
jgi:flavin-dependent dehydrogenase